ncbi:hypothetical protein HOC37_05500 [bacterium]|jgi:hypothetical protein|nr:hypothetical protein [bacterium]MBT3580851.1 hypothetical protein [bacterium]MBT4552417.1 hypothetical protein [bacterium]MBT5989087.1 hypothetical protein [bacterium]MBT7088044.1 hypothetical protein [bacterium]
MNEVLGLLDSLEATILESKKIPLTDKVIIEEKNLLSLIDKMRLTLKSNGDIVHEALTTSEPKNFQTAQPPSFYNLKPGQKNSYYTDQKADEILTDAQDNAKEIIQGAKDYADQVLANLQLTVTKNQKNLGMMEKTLENSREILDKIAKKQKETVINEKN